MTSPARDRRKGVKQKREHRLRNPAQLRMAIASAVLTAGYLGVYSPLSANIDESVRKLTAEKKRLDAACEIESLREQYQSFKDRLPEQSDTNEWVQYILGGVRRFPLKLLVLDPDLVRDVGPYKAAVLKVDLEGNLTEMNGFLNWLETNDRLIRIDMVNIQPDQKKSGTLNMRLIVLGLMP
jgi:Tfp pilus assembly protein PilO